MPRGRKAVEGISSYQHRMMFVKQPALWDEAIRRAKIEGISLSAYIEKLIRAEIEKANGTEAKASQAWEQDESHPNQEAT